MALDNLRGGTKRVVEENTPLNNLRGGTKRVVIVDGGGSSLPDQTGNAGKFLTTDGTDASWGTINALQNTATGTDSLTVSGIATAAMGNTNIGVGATMGGATSYGVATGNEAKVTQSGGVAIGAVTESAYDSVAIGRLAKATGGSCIQLGSRGTNNETGTFKVALTNASYVTQNYKLLDYDGTVPTARLTKVNTTVTLAVADWSSNTQTVTVSGVKADSVVFVSPAPASASDYASAGILCTSQSADSLTFSCTQTPSVAIVVNIVCM